MVSAGLLLPFLFLVMSSLVDPRHLGQAFLSSPLASGADVSQPLIILVVALALAGIAILILFAKDRI
jgi:hypothetical protein